MMLIYTCVLTFPLKRKGKMFDRKHQLLKIKYETWYRCYREMQSYENIF